jgi:hypothetical protein
MWPDDALGRSTLAYPWATGPELGCHDVRGGNLDGGGVKTYSVAGFVLPDFSKGLLWGTGSPPCLSSALWLSWNAAETGAPSK